MKTLEILNPLLNFCITHNLETRLVANNLVYMHYIILTLSFVTEQENFHEYLQEDDNVRFMVIALLENMTISTKSRVFADYFARTRAKIITEILLMLLSVSEKEAIDAVEQPKEFMNLA